MSKKMEWSTLDSSIQLWDEVEIIRHYFTETRSIPIYAHTLKISLIARHFYAKESWIYY